MMRAPAAEIPSPVGYGHQNTTLPPDKHGVLTDANVQVVMRLRNNVGICRVVNGVTQAGCAWASVTFVISMTTATVSWM